MPEAVDKVMLVDDSEIDLFINRRFSSFRCTVRSRGGVTAYWGVEDVQKSFDDLISAGASAHEDPHNVGGEIVVATVLDPWGNPFGLIYNPEFRVE